MVILAHITCEEKNDEEALALLFYMVKFKFTAGVAIES